MKCQCCFWEGKIDESEPCPACGEASWEVSEEKAPAKKQSRGRGAKKPAEEHAEELVLAEFVPPVEESEAEKAPAEVSRYFSADTEVP